MSALPEQEFLREARRMLRLLASPHAGLAPQKDGRWAVVRRGEPGSSRMRVGAGMAEALLAREWLVRRPTGDLVLSGTGGAWLAAELAGIDPLAAQHKALRLQTLPAEAGDSALVAINEAESPLAWLKAHGGITDVQAGEKLPRDYTIARLEPRLTADLEAPKGQGRGRDDPALMPDTVLAAKQRLAGAMKAVGPGLSDLLFDVCCALKSMAGIEACNGWPRRSAKIVLGLALDRLAEHYGLSRPPRPARLRSWSADLAEAAIG